MTAAPLRIVAGEPPTLRMLANILGSLARGFDEAGCPLSDEQQAFLDGAIAQVSS